MLGTPVAPPSPDNDVVDEVDGHRLVAKNFCSYKESANYNEPKGGTIKHLVENALGIL